MTTLKVLFLKKNPVVAWSFEMKFSRDILLINLMIRQKALVAKVY